MYTSPRPLHGCFTCLSEDEGSDEEEISERCTIRGGAPICNKVGKSTIVRIPNFEDEEGSKFYADFIFVSSDIFAWSSLGQLYFSCYGRENLFAKDDIEFQSAAIYRMGLFTRASLGVCRCSVIL